MTPVKKMLLVDDEPELLDTLKDVFEPRGFTCFTAKDGLEAIKSAKKNKPSIIILDLIMPIMDGIEACKTLKSNAKTKDIPLIVYTAQPPEVLAKKDHAFDVITVLIKPFDTRELISAVDHALAKANPEKPKAATEY